MFKLYNITYGDGIKPFSSIIFIIDDNFTFAAELQKQLITKSDVIFEVIKCYEQRKLNVAANLFLYIKYTKSNVPSFLNVFQDRIPIEYINKIRKMLLLV